MVIWIRRICILNWSVISEMEPILQHTSAFVCFMKNVRDSDSGTGPTAQLELFKYCTIIQDNVSWKLFFPNLSICVAADGCATNATVLDVLVGQIGILSPNARCSAHAAHGSIKRLTGSKALCKGDCVIYCSNTPCLYTL